MKLKLFWLALVMLAIVLPANSENNKASNEFLRSFNRLHHEPPPPMLKSQAKIAEKWITQSVDNFSSSDKRSWKMRYFENSEFYEPGGPLFINVGGEWEVTSSHLSGGHLYDMAKEHHGYLFYTEHRFYGESKPLSNLSIENLRYLEVRQALADLAHFIRTMKATIKGMTKSKVILFGCSYAGTMVTWFSREYPDLVQGAWATSAPLLAKVNFKEYTEVVGKSIKQIGGQACYNRIHNAVAQLETMFAKKKGAEVKAMLNLCSSFDEQSELDLEILFRKFTLYFSGSVQFHENNTIQSVCEELLKDKSDVDGLVKLMRREWNNTASCTKLKYESTLNYNRNISYDHNGTRQWYYQTCNGFGWFVTTDSKKQPFGTSMTLKLRLQWCRDLFGEQFTSEFVHNQVAATNKYFGGLQPKVKNVYMTHGQLDPWAAIGLQKGELTAIIPNHSHCPDRDSISASDSLELRKSKERIAQLVRKWLA